MSEEDILAIAAEVALPERNDSNRMVEDGHSRETWFNEGIDMEWSRSFPGEKCWGNDKPAHADLGVFTEDDGSLWWLETDWRRGGLFKGQPDPHRQGLVEGPEHLRQLLANFFSEDKSV